MRARGTWLVAAALLGGCAVGPDYQRPDLTLPQRWRIDVPQSAAIANTRWWEQFDDPVLSALIGEALRANTDLAIAAARVEQFAGALTATRSQLYPQIGYNAQASRNRVSREGYPALGAGADPTYSLYQGALGAQWQLDLFGQVSRRSEAAQAQLYASEQGRRGVVLSIVTSVAASYVALRALDRQLEIARATADNYADTRKIFDLRFKGGVVSEVEVAQVESQVQQALASIPALEQQIAAQENLMAILLARDPGPIPRGRTIDALVAPAVPAGLPSALLDRRPDILQAEQNLVAANAAVGAARALYFPSLTLTGGFGSTSAALGSFLTGPSTMASLAAGLAGPVFTFGGIEGQVESAEAAQREATAFYRQTVLGALRETNDALTGAVKTREQAEAQVRRTAALRDYARLSRLKFDNGYASYLDVLYADNELFSAELETVRAIAARQGQLIAVYKALGGGWVDEAARLAPQPQSGLSGGAAAQAEAR